MLGRWVNPFSGFALAALSIAPAFAQSFCSSDGQTTPIALQERFISADCHTCWHEAPLSKLSPGVLALDWIVPAPMGDEAALSTAATREALERLQNLKAQPPTASQASFHSTNSLRRAGKLRVAHGLPFNNYIGASISYTQRVRSNRPHHVDAPPGTDAWLVLVETIAAGSDGSPIERNLVRGVLVTPVTPSTGPEPTKVQKFSEARPMSIPEGSRAERLRLVGWIQDAKGDVLTIAQSRCKS